MPCTVALHWDVADGATVVGVQITETEVMLELGCTVTVAEPDLEVSWVLVAVTVTVTDPLDPGAFSRPDELIVPALVFHVTAEL